MPVSDPVMRTRLYSLGDIILRIAHGIIQAEPSGEKGGDCRRKGAAGSVGIRSIQTAGFQFNEIAGLGIIEYVRKIFVGKMACFQQYGYLAVLRQAPGAFRQFRLEGYLLSQQYFGFRDIWSNHPRERHQYRFQGLDRIRLQKRVPRSRHHHRIQDDIPHIIFFKGLLHGRYKSGTVKHTDLDFLGALYLFTINCIFIILATYLTVKYMKFGQYEYKDEKAGKRARRLITAVTVIVIVPSIWSAIVMIRENTFNETVSDFINANRNMYSGYIMDYKVEHRNGSRVEVYFTGEPLSASEKNNFMESAKEYGLKPEQVIIKEHALVEGTDQAEILKGIYERTDSEITRREAEIKKLEDQLALMHASDIPYEQISREAANQYPGITSLLVARGARTDIDGYSRTDGLVAVVSTSVPFTEEERERFTNWLKIRLDTENVTMYEIHEKLDEGKEKAEGRQ